MKTTNQLTAEGRKFEQVLNEIGKLQVRIGFQRGEQIYDDESGTEVDMCDVAAWNELGTERAPSRPFMRDAIDKHINDINSFMDGEKQKLINGESAEKILNECGIFVKDLIQNEIREGDFIENAPYTIAKKGSSHPLIDTGRMRQSVNYVIKEKGGDDE